LCFLVLATQTVAQTVPPNIPAAIMCYAEADQSWRVGYLSKVSKNGDAEYVSGRLVGASTTPLALSVALSLPLRLAGLGVLTH
jgi:hypothetical protein